MPHADSALLPPSISSPSEFYAHVSAQIAALCEGQRAWVCNLANAASLLYAALNEWKGREGKRCNWSGFYLLSPLIPHAGPQKRPTLLLGPFHGLPACQAIPSIVGKGVCADGSAVLPPTTVVVPDTDAYPGHIACDSASRSEIVVPLVIARSRLAAFDASAPEWAGRGEGDEVIIGVLDIDCEQLEGFDEEDRKGLEGIARLLVDACDW